MTTTSQPGPTVVQLTRKRVLLAGALTGLALLAAGWVGTRLAGPAVVEGFVVALPEDAICLSSDAPDPSDPMYGKTDGLLGEITGRDCAFLGASDALRSDLRLGQPIRALIVEVDAVGGMPGGRMLLNYEKLP